MRTLHVGMSELHGAAHADRDVIVNWLHDIGVITAQAVGFHIADAVEPFNVVVFFRGSDAVSFVCAPPAPMAAVRRVGVVLDDGPTAGDERDRRLINAWGDE